jgi:hypothetical protein
MVLAISFLEAPLKFRAPGVTLQVGLSIGRLVFRAVNTVEAVLAAGVVIALGLDAPSPTLVVAAALAIGALVVQLLVVRPRLSRRTDAVLAAPELPAGASGRRSRAHYGYVGLEIVKVVALLAGGAVLLTG